MRMILAAAVALAIMPSGALAQTCEPITTDPSFCLRGGLCLPGNIAGEYYIVVDWCGTDGCQSTVWIYEETNGIDLLQRNDDFAGDHTCGMFPADTVVF